MSREYFVESHLEDLVDKFMEEGMSEEDAIHKATSFYDGRANRAEEKALRSHEREKKLEHYVDNKYGVMTNE